MLSTKNRLGIGAALLLGVCGHASAGNGLNLIGFGAESSALAGADLAVSRGVAAMNINPAGLAGIESHQFDLYGALVFLPKSNFEDALNRRPIDNRPYVLGNLGYAWRPEGSRFTYGIGLFAQGGAGAERKNYNTLFGTQDELTSLFAAVRITPTVAWQATERLSLGVALGVAYARREDRFFPETSAVTANGPFLGFSVEQLDGTAFSPHIGLRYLYSDRLTLAASYKPRTNLTLSGDDMQVNMTALGLGKVRYSRVRFSGIDLPAEVSLGLAWKATQKLTLSADLSHLDWSEAVRRSELRASGPDNALAPAELLFPGTLNWRDQYVIAVGAAYRHNERHTFFGGYNYGRSPAPDNTLGPLLSAITEYHLTAGWQRRFDGGLTFTLALEYNLPESVRYTNPEQPFGRDTLVDAELLLVHAALKYDF